MSSLRLLCLQHSPTEGPENIAKWAAERGHVIETLNVFEEPLDQAGDYDLLLVMGGPMGTYDEKEYPWLADEKRFMKRAIADGKAVLGICLGAQLLAEVTGGRVYKGSCHEIGWYQVELSEKGENDQLFLGFPPRFTAFHWHGDTFDLPENAVHLASSQLYPNQAFRIGHKIVGLQFHPEVSEDQLLRWIEETRDDRPKEQWVQRPDEILHQADRVSKLRALLDLFMDRLVSLIAP